MGYLANKAYNGNSMEFHHCSEIDLPYGIST